MLHPLLRLMATQPQLLLDHAQGYAELVTTEMGSVAANWRRRALLHAMTLCCLVVAAVLAGVALMLWAVTPAVPAQALWVLIGAPLLPVAVGLWCLNEVRVQGEAGAFDGVRRQLAEDLMLLREASAP